MAFKTASRQKAIGEMQTSSINTRAHYQGKMLRVTLVNRLVIAYTPIRITHHSSITVLNLFGTTLNDYFSFHDI